MGYTVKESVESQERSQNGARRVYIVRWDGAGENSPELARTAAIAYLADFAEKYTAPNLGRIRQISAGDPIDYAHERRLDYWLHGFPSQTMDAVEVSGTEGRVYRATAAWGLAATGGGQARITQTQVNTTFATLVGGANVTVTTAPRTSGGVQGASVDYLPLVALLSRELLADESAPKPPEFQPGTLNAIAQDAEGSPVKVRGLEYNRPDPRVTAEITVQGAGVLSAWKTALIDAADRGSLNAATFTIDGIAWQPGELLLVSAEFSPDTSGATRVVVGFASGRRTTLTVGGATNKRTAANPFVHGSPEFYFYSPANPSTGPFYVSPHDYVWNYTRNVGTPPAVSMRIDNTSIHRPWQVLDYTTIFGGNSLG